jgi:hypothetical protein
MHLYEIENIISRVNRLVETISSNEGRGSSWSVKSSDGEIYEFHIDDILCSNQLIDDIAFLFITLWSIKDYFKKYLISRGVDPKSANSIENKINESNSMCICADIANTIKHQSLTKSRSGFYPQLSCPQYIIDQPVIDTIEFRQGKLNVKPSNPSKVKILLPILDNNKQPIEDAFVIFDKAINFWEKIFEEYNIDFSEIS